MIVKLRIIVVTFVQHAWNDTQKLSSL